MSENAKPAEQPPFAGASGSAFHVGQSVRVLESIYDPPSGETPGGTYALRGEIVVVRHIGEGTYPIRVSHPNRKDDNTFSVSPKEIEPWVESPNASPSATGQEGKQ